MAVRPGVVVGNVQSAALPALLAATSPSAKDGIFYGPQWPGSVGGPPGESPLWAPFRSHDDAARLWQVSHDLIAGAPV